MRAIFLGSGHGSCGTGVFLPQGAGTNSQPSNRPGRRLVFPCKYAHVCLHHSQKMEVHHGMENEFCSFLNHVLAILIKIDVNKHVINMTHIVFYLSESHILNAIIL